MSKIIDEKIQKMVSGYKFSNIFQIFSYYPFETQYFRFVLAFSRFDKKI